MSSMPARRDVILALLWPSRVHDLNYVNAVFHGSASFQLHERLSWVCRAG